MRYHKLINLIKPLLFVLALAVFGLLPRKGWA